MCIIMLHDSTTGLYISFDDQGLSEWHMYLVWLYSNVDEHSASLVKLLEVWYMVFTCELEY